MTFYGKKRFIYLNNESNRLESLFNYLTPNQDYYIFRKEGDFKGYYFFNSLYSFYEWYRKIPIQKHLFHEIVCKGYQKFRMDIDEYTPYIDIILELISNLFLKWFHIKPTIEIFDNETTYHLVISNIVFSNNYFCLQICEEIEYHLLLNYNLQINIDRGIYSNNHSFRIEGSTKLGETRYKKNRNYKIVDFDSFSKGIIKYYKNCYFIDRHELFQNSKPANKLCLHDNLNIDNLYDPSIFKIRNSSLRLSIILLNRIKPSFCSICNRVHEKENAFITKFDKKFHCFRNIDNYKKPNNS